ncbi:MAG: nucleotide-binding protein [Nanoarchaeota archaeon]|nr:nucleotide-binding protein [Nanoarchaeota archaeon]
MKKILLDTNFLLAVYQFKVDIFTELDRICNFNYKLFILDKTIEELKHIIERQKGKHKDAARVALQLLKLRKVGVIKTGSKKHTDDVILDYAEKDYLVATQDKDLKRRLIHHNVKVIVLRQKKILAIVNDQGFD